MKLLLTDPEAIDPPTWFVILYAGVLVFFLTMLFLCAWRLKTFPFN